MIFQLKLGFLFAAKRVWHTELNIHINKPSLLHQWHPPTCLPVLHKNFHPNPLFSVSHPPKPLLNSHHSG